MAGATLAGAMGIGSAIFGGKKASQAMRRVQKNLNQQMEENQDWYDRRYNEDATQRADAQAALTQAREDWKQRNQDAAGSAAVMGGTDESVAEQKAAGAQAMADATGQIAMAGDQRKDAIENQYMAKKDDVNSQLNALEEAKAKNIAGAAQGVAQAAGGIFSMG